MHEERIIDVTYEDEDIRRKTTALPSRIYFGTLIITITLHSYIIRIRRLSREWLVATK